MPGYLLEVPAYEGTIVLGQVRSRIGNTRAKAASSYEACPANCYAASQKQDEAERLVKSDATTQGGCHVYQLASLPDGNAMMSNADSEAGAKRSISDLRRDIRSIQADLEDQGVRLFPATLTGDRARTLWRQIKPRLIQGVAVELTVSALGLGWHREQLKRARATLIDMKLIKRRADGQFTLGSLGPCSQIDELIRDDFFALKLLEGVVVALSAITKSKTQQDRRRS